MGQKFLFSTGKCAKKIVPLCILFWFCTACSVQKEPLKSDWTKLNLCGKIKSIRQMPQHIRARNGAFIVGEPWPHAENNSYFLFDKGGNLIEKRLYFTNGNNYSRELYFYDEEGYRFKEILYNPNGSIGSRIVYTFDKKGKIAQSECFNYLGVNFIYKYDGDGNRIEAHKYYGDGKLYYKATYRYDKKGNRTEEKVFTGDGKLFSKWKYVYDDVGNRTVKERYFANGQLDCRFTFEYDAEHKKTLWKTFGPEGKLLSQGSYSYEYDSRGNWIRKTKKEGAEPIYILEREIEYF